MRSGFKSREHHDFFFFFFFFDFFIYLFILCFLSLLLQFKFANLILLSLLSFYYFITPYDAQASSAFSALIFIVRMICTHFFDKNNASQKCNVTPATPASLPPHPLHCPPSPPYPPHQFNTHVRQKWKINDTWNSQS